MNTAGAAMSIPLYNPPFDPLLKSANVMHFVKSKKAKDIKLTNEVAFAGRSIGKTQERLKRKIASRR
jgi:hypothetical protein